MAKKIIGKIVLYEPMNQDKIDQWLLGSDLIVFEIQRQYKLGEVPQLLTAVLPSEFTDVTVNYVQALKDVVDISTWKHEENSIFFKINYDSGLKEFDLSESYVRLKKQTVAPFTEPTTGQELKAVFITPGLDGPVSTSIDVNYNELISAGDSSALLAVGIELNLGSTGKLFSIKTQSVPFRVSFIQPAASLENYVIDFELQNKTIEI